MESVTSRAETDAAPASWWGRVRQRHRDNRSVLVIAVSAGVASFSMNFWYPFLPLYMKQLGATSDANALAWMGIAIMGQGVARLVSGPLWGIVSDRVGRKLMYVRALYFATVTSAVAALATEPWHVAVALASQGLFSGFIPAAVALTSVTVPDAKLNSSLGLVTAAQNLGNTVGPAVGAGLSILFGFRGSIVAAAIMPSVAATLVLFVVPRDHVEWRRTAPTTPAPSAATTLTPPRSFWRTLTAQFYLALFLYFFLFAATQMVRLATPLAIGDVTGHDGVEGIVGVAFTIAGIASVVGALVVARRWVRPGRFVRMLALGSLCAAGAHLLLSVAVNVPVFIVWFACISLTQAAMVPASNTLIASAVPRERRGTAFGLASSAQALAFMVGPITMAGFATASIWLGFAVVGGLFLGLAVLLHFCLREPSSTEVVEPEVQVQMPPLSDTTLLSEQLGLEVPGRGTGRASSVKRPE